VTPCALHQIVRHWLWGDNARFPRCAHKVDPLQCKFGGHAPKAVHWPVLYLTFDQVQFGPSRLEFIAPVCLEWTWLVRRFALYSRTHNTTRKELVRARTPYGCDHDGRSWVKENDKRFKKCTMTDERNVFQMGVITLEGSGLPVRSIRNTLAAINRIPQEVLSLVSYLFGVDEEPITMAPEAVGTRHFVWRSAEVSVVSPSLGPAIDVASYPNRQAHAGSPTRKRCWERSFDNGDRLLMRNVWRRQAAPGMS